jgi:hypothetical protein
MQQSQQDGQAPGPAQDERAAFVAIVRARRASVAKAAERLARRDTRLTLMSVVASAAATVLTAAPAMGGPGLTRALGSAGPETPSWRILCGVASLCSLLAAVATNLHRQSEVTSRLARCQAGAARLEALELQVSFQNAPLPDATGEYGRIVAELPPMPDA